MLGIHRASTWVRDEAVQAELELQHGAGRGSGMCNAHRGERPGAQIARRGAGYSSRRGYQGLLRRDAWCLAISWHGGGAQCTTYDMGLLLVCREISMARWCDSRYGMILYVGVLDDGHGSSSGYGTVSVSRGVAVAQGRVKGKEGRCTGSARLPLLVGSEARGAVVQQQRKSSTTEKQR